MGLPYVTSFCCCLGLEVGAALVGVVHLAASVVLLVVCSLFASSVGGQAGTVEDADLLYTTWRRIALAAALLSAAHVLLAATLLYGVYKRNSVALRVWLYLMCVLWAGGLLFVVVTAATHGLAGSGSDVFLAFLQGLAMFVVIAYCILAVFSYYLVLRSSEELDSPTKVDY